MKICKGPNSSYPIKGTVPPDWFIILTHLDPLLICQQEISNAVSAPRCHWRHQIKIIFLLLITKFSNTWFEPMICGHKNCFKRIIPTKQFQLLRGVVDTAPRCYRRCELTGYIMQLKCTLSQDFSLYRYSWAPQLLTYFLGENMVKSIFVKVQTELKKFK